MRNRNLNRFLAIGSIATGVALASAAPAGAIVLSGGLNFSDGAADFFTSTAQTSYNIVFNPTSLAQINGKSGNFAPFFGGPLANLTSSSTATFNQVVGDVFSLASPLNFNFSSGVTISINAGSTFNRNFNSVAGVGFSNLNVTGQAINGTDSVNLPSLSFTFNDDPESNGGSYGITLATTNPLVAVPEPFTIIGTMLGGAAALRMRKRLKAENKL